MEKDLTGNTNMVSRHQMKQSHVFLLRWNPAISSFKLEYYVDALERYGHNFGMDWSVWEYQYARKGDLYYMLREGDGINPGIMFRGVFTSDPYAEDDWRGSANKRYYVDIECYGCTWPDEEPIIPTDLLDERIPGIDWHKGHSGQLLTPDIAEKLTELWEERQGDAEDEDKEE